MAVSLVMAKSLTITESRAVSLVDIWHWGQRAEYFTDAAQNPFSAHGIKHRYTTVHSDDEPARGPIGHLMRSPRVVRLQGVFTRRTKKTQRTGRFNSVKTFSNTQWKERRRRDIRNEEENQMVQCFLWNGKAYMLFVGYL